MSTMTMARYPVAPTVTKRKSTLLDVATVTDHFQWLDGVALFQTFNCMTFLGSAEFCAPNTKDLDGTATWTDGFRFSAYGGFTCKPIGRDPETDAKIASAFEAGESTAVEAAFSAIRFVVNAAGDAPLPGEWPAPASISAAVATPALLLAALEEYGATHYNGAPTLHLPVGLASQLAATDALLWDGDILRTKLGSKVAVGVGYSLAAPKKAYVTGEVWVGRSEVVNVSAMDTTNNNEVNLVERGYVAAVDCFAATVSLT
jgi:hypothetical protein